MWIFGTMVLAASVAPAQSMPPVTRSKQAATNAVAAANARTRASSTLPADSTPRTRSARSPGRRPVAIDSAAGSTAMKPAESLFERETYRYSKDGRRDPFVSLMAPGELRPMISDLELVAVAWDRSGRNSVAVLHDISTKDREQYRVRVGQSLGRMRVASITPKSVVFTIEEFGYSRQATLAIEDSNKERMK
jgi:hypothetical protein